MVGILAAALISVSLFCAYLWFLHGKEDPPTAQSNPETENNMSSSQTAIKPQRRGITSAQLAASKNVPATKERPDGSYALVSVVEGQEANVKLTNALQIIGQQRTRLATLKQQFNVVPISAQQQRELLAGEINRTEGTLKQNLAFMQANYAYNLNNVYMLVPENAELVLNPTAEGENVKVLKEFKDFAAYEGFQESRGEYLSRLNVLVEEWKVTKAEELGESPQQISKEDLSDLKKSDVQLSSLLKGLEAEFGFNPDLNHRVQFSKSGLYVKTAQK